MPHNLHNTLQTFKLSSGATGQYYSLPALEAAGVGRVSRLPVSIRIVLESVLRNCDGKKVTAEHDRRAIGRRRLDHIRSDPSRRTGPVFDDHRLSDRVLELVGDDARDEIGGAPRREPDDDPHRLVHLVLREYGRGDCQEQSTCAGEKR